MRIVNVTLRFDKMHLDVYQKEDLSVVLRNFGYGIMTNPEYRDEGVIYLKDAPDFMAADAYLNSMCISHYESTQEIQVI